MNGPGDAQTGFSLFAGESGDDCVFRDKSADVNTLEPDVPA